MEHDEDLHRAYDKMIEAIQNYIQLKNTDERFLVSDWIVFTASVTIEDEGGIYYDYVSAGGPPHVQEGMMAIAKETMRSVIRME